MPSPSQNGGPHARPSSPVSGRSTLTTSAPSAARIWAQYGPAIDVVTSSTRIPCERRVHRAHHRPPRSATMRCRVFDEFVDWVSGARLELRGDLRRRPRSTRSSRSSRARRVITAATSRSSGDLSLLARHPLPRARARSSATTSPTGSAWLGERTVKRVFRAREVAQGVRSGPSDQLEARGFYIIIIARFIPGGRTAVTFSSGYTHGMPWRRFVVADAVAGLIWGTLRGDARLHRWQDSSRRSPGRACSSRSSIAVSSRSSSSSSPVPARATEARGRRRDGARGRRLAVSRFRRLRRFRARARASRVRSTTRRRAGSRARACRAGR